jgi:hypothetical protein
MTMIGDLKSRLGGIAQGTAKCDDATAAIGKAAAERMAEIDRKLDELRPATLTNEASATEYSDLIEERGVLALALGQA